MIIGSVFKNITNPAEIGNNNSFSMSFTNVIAFELYQYTKKYGYFTKNFYCCIKKLVGDGGETDFHHDIGVKVFVKKVDILASRKLSLIETKKLKNYKNWFLAELFVFTVAIPKMTDLRHERC